MLRYSRVTLALTALALVATFVGGCKEKSPEEKVAELRSRYKARLNGMFVKSTPLGGEEAAEGAPGEAAEGEPAAGEEPAVEGDGEGEEAAPPEVQQDVHLDILIQHDSDERLPGITLDVTMVDAEKNLKNRWLVWVDTAGIAKATGTQISHVLEDVDYVVGDGFDVEVRHPVPEAERGDYREFAAAGP